AAGKAVRGVQPGRCHDRSALRRHGTWPCPLAQARAHDGWRCDRDERAGQRFGVHGAPAEPCGYTLTTHIHKRGTSPPAEQSRQWGSTTQTSTTVRRYNGTGGDWRFGAGTATAERQRASLRHKLLCWCLSTRRTLRSATNPIVKIAINAMLWWICMACHSWPVASVITAFPPVSAGNAEVRPVVAYAAAA